MKATGRDFLREGGIDRFRGDLKLEEIKVSLCSLYAQNGILVPLRGSFKISGEHPRAFDMGVSPRVEPLVGPKK